MKDEMKMGKGVFSFGHQLAEKFGFTEDKFDGWLGKKGHYIYISFIISKQEGKGNLSRLFDEILKAGYGIKVPTPFAHMMSICVKKGFKRTFEYSQDFREHVEVWVKEGSVKCS